MPRRRFVLVQRSRQTVAPHGTRYARCHGAALPFEDVGKRSTEAMAGESLAPDPSGEQQALVASHPHQPPGVEPLADVVPEGHH